ncbi:MAG TPA: hypothetical protein VIJ28_22035 [Chloroflexota bacterium]
MAHVIYQAAGQPPDQAIGHYTREGSTSRFVVSYDQSLGAHGKTLAAAMLQTCERDYAATAAYFGNLTPAGLPITVYLDPGTNGAYHTTCADTGLHCDIFGGANPDLVRMLMVAELVEVFEDAQGAGWNCGYSNGEALSRILATLQYPAQLDGFATAGVWLDSDRPDFVNQNDPTDRNPVSTGCAVLFLYYLRGQLGYAWPDIVRVGSQTPRQTYATLSGRSDDPFPAFSALLANAFPPGTPSGLTGDNPFPHPTS